MTNSRRYPSRPILGVGAVVIDDDRVLLIKRGQAPLKDEWSLPGGSVEVGESLEAAVAREVLEETGLVVGVGPVIEVLDRIHRDGDDRIEYHFVIIDYLCTTVSGTLSASSDAADARWVRTGDLDEYHLTEKARQVIARAFERVHPRR